jgi:hypothetical protein
MCVSNVCNPKKNPLHGKKMEFPPSPPPMDSQPTLHIIVSIFFLTVALLGFITAAWFSNALRCCDDFEEEQAPVLSSDGALVDDPDTPEKDETRA